MGNPIERELEQIRREQQRNVNAPLSPVLPIAPLPPTQDPDELLARLRAANQLGRSLPQQNMREAGRLAERLGLPAEVVASDLDAVRSRDFDRIAEQVAREAPVTARWGAEPATAAMVGDNGWNLLTRVERIFGASIGSALLQARQPGLVQPSYRPVEPEAPLTPAQRRGAIVTEFQRSKAQFDLGLYQALQTPGSRQLPAVQKELNRLRGQVKSFDLPEVGGGVGGVAEEIARSSSNIVASISEYVEGAILGATGAAAGAIAVAIGTGGTALPAAGGILTAGAAVGGTARLYQFSSGLAIERYLEAGIDPATADVLGRSTGVAITALENLGLTRLAKSVGLNTSALTSRVTQRVLQDMTTGKALARGAREFVGVAAYETGIEVAQQAAELGGEQVGRMMSNLPSISGEQIVDELLTTAYTTALGMGVVGLPGAAVTTVTELDRVERAKQAQTFLAALGSSAEAVELRTQVPEQFQELLQRQVSEYGPVQDIGIPVDRFIAYWQERNVDPRVVAQEILGDTTAYDQAVEQGTADVVIPLANFVAKVAGTEHYAGLLPDVRLRPDDLTGREAEAQESKLREDIEAMRAEVEQVAQAETLEGEAARVLDDVTAKITATGVYTADQVATMARSIAAPYIVMAKRSGQSPWQLYSSRNINVLEPVRAEKLYDAIVEMEEAMKVDPSSPESLAAIERVNVLRGELEELPGGREVAARALTPMVMPASAVEVGQRVVLPDGRSAVVVGQEAGQTNVRIAGQRGEVTPIDGAREVQVPGAVLRQEQTPTPALEQTTNLRAAFEVARASTFARNRDFKQVLQDRALEAAARDGIDLSTMDAAALDYLVRVGIADANYAIEANPNAIGWYERKVKAALSIMSEVFPEIATDEDARFAFIFALATTSNGLKVDLNLKLASEVYGQYRQTGQMPTNVQAGNAQEAINGSLETFNELAQVYGLDLFRRMMLTQFPVGTLKAMGFSITGEHVDVIVRGAAIIGPKIGNGFFSNLYGFFDALTMDRWLTRTWGRWSGTLLEVDPEDVAKKSTELRELIDELRKSPAKLTKLQDILKLTLDEDPAVIAEKIDKVSMKKEPREALNALNIGKRNIGYQIRTKGRALKGAIDGQKEAPANAQERKLIRSVFSRILQDVQTRVPEMTMADLQAVLWYPEKRLYDSAVLEADQAETEYADDEAPDYANAAAKLARSQGISEETIQNAIRRSEADGRAADAQRGDGGAEAVTRTGADDVGLSGQDRSNFIVGSILRDLRSNRGRDGKAPDAYTRKGGRDGQSVRILDGDVPVLGEYRPWIVFKNRIAAAGNRAPAFYELATGDATAAEAFVKGITASKNATPFGAAVYIYSAEEYATMRLFLSEDGTVGFALKPDGDIVSVFSRGGGARGAIELALQLGGKKLDAFDTILPEYYAAHGLREVARLPWDDAQAPEGWDAATFAEYNNGRPDVVFMVFDPQLLAEQAPYVANYEAAVKAQADAVAVASQRQARQAITRILEQAATPEGADASLEQLIKAAFRAPAPFTELPPTIEVDGVQRPTTNSQGQQITPNATTMRAFWRWFGDSKVVDEQGRPIVQYHGTAAEVDFDTFRLNPVEMGVHVGTQKSASDRVLALTGGIPSGEGVGPRIITLYAKAENPLRLEDLGGFAPRVTVLSQLVDIGLVTEQKAYEALYKEGGQFTDRQVYENTMQLVRELGYDSIVYVNRYEGISKEDEGKGGQEALRRKSDAEWLARFPSSPDSYIVFSEQQVKSPANVGTFSKRLKSTMRQEGRSRPNAFIIPGVGRTTIALMNTANLSSLMHEFAHDYLNLLFDVAETPEATEQIKADAALVLKEFGVTDRSQLTVEHQERWARMFESYLEEGKAPTRGLERAFSRFKAWLSAIYRTARSVLIPVSPEVRGVFDRMLATDEEIADALRQNESQPLFLTAEEANMTDAEFASYQQAVADRNELAGAALLKQLLLERNKERRQVWKDRQDELTAAVTEQVKMEPVQQVVYFLKTGKLISGEALPEGVAPLKLSKALLVARYGEEIVRSLPRGVYSVEGGVDPDVVALSFGFSSGDAMITQMQAYEPTDARIKRIVKETMAREFPDLLGDSPALADAAQQAVHRSPTDQLLYAELVKLGRSDAMIPSVNLRAVRMAAKEIVAKMRLRDISPERFRLAEAKAGRLAYAAMRKGDVVQAAFHKRQQLLNHILYREATDAIDLSAAALKFFGKMSKTATRERLGKAGPEFLAQMDRLLEQYGFARVSGAELDRQVALSEWVAAQLERGIPVEVPAYVLHNMRQTNYRLLTTEQLQGVYDTGRQIYHVARAQGKLLAEAKQRSLEEVRDAVVETIAKYHTIEPRQPDYAPSKLKAVANFLKKIDAWHVKPEFLFRWLDGDKAFGPVWTALFQPIAEAENAESAMVIEASKRITELFDLIPEKRRKEFLSRTITVPGVDTKMTGATAVAMALNWGNVGNREALLESTINGQPVWTRAQVDAVLATLTKDEWTFVQGVWDYINEFWPQISALQQELTGVAPEKVEAEPFEVRTADGETIKLQGGYYPLQYDQEYSWAQWKQDQAATVQEMGANPYVRAATRHGFTEARVGSGGRPVKLDLSVFSEHVLNVIHDLTHRKAIMDVQRVSELPEVRTAIEGTAGRDLYRTIRPWLLRIAGDRRPAASPIEDLLGRARVGVTVVNMGLKVTTAIVQPVGYLQSVEMLGVKYARRGLQAFFSNPAKTWKAAQQQSVALRTRQESFDRDVRDQTKRLLKKGPLTKAQQGFFYFTAMMDMAVAVPTWYGAYLKSIETLKPGDQHAAVTYADSVVRMTQGSGAAKDLSQIQGGGELARSFTLFYTYFNALYNLLRRSGALLKDRGPSDIPRFLGSMAALWLVPAVLSELLAGRGPDDEDDTMNWAMWELLRFPFSTVVGVRDIASAIGPDAYDYELSPVVDAGKAVVNTLNAVGAAAGEAARGEGFELTEGQVKEFMMAVGYWAQLPSRQMYITGSYLYDWMMGYEEPESPAEVLRGLAFPRQK